MTIKKIIGTKIKKKCKVFNCDRDHSGLGYCTRHYQQFKTYGYTFETKRNKFKPKKCSFNGCINEAVTGGMCIKHDIQVRRNGIATVTRYDRNVYIDYGSYAEIILRNSKTQEEECRAIIDSEDIEKCMPLKWYYYSSDRYVMSSPEHIPLHRFVLSGVKDSDITDHYNRNPLDNRKKNLIIGPHGWNEVNAPIRKTNTHGYPGIGYCNRGRIKKWTARIGANKKYKSLGYFLTKEEAIQARKAAEIKYYGRNRYQDELMLKTIGGK